MKKRENPGSDRNDIGNIEADWFKFNKNVSSSEPQWGTEANEIPKEDTVEFLLEMMSLGYDNISCSLFSRFKNESRKDSRWMLKWGKKVGPFFEGYWRLGDFMGEF